MRPVLFAVCFTVGLSLMILSGYLPKSANAHNGSQDNADAAAEEHPGRPRRPIYRPAPARTRGHLWNAGRSAPARDPRIDPASIEPEEAHADTHDSPADPNAVATEDPVDPAVVTAANEGLRKLDAAFDDAGDEPAEEAVDDEQTPTAAAGLDGVAWIGWDEITLDGGASTGEGLTYAWKQVSGPVTLKIGQPNQAQTTATGFPLGVTMDWSPALYEFELTVTDAGGRQASDRVEYVVLSAPELVITPPAERTFKLRDGYFLAHFESWTTNVETYESAFEIASPTALTFTKVTGGAYKTARRRSGDGYEYRITLYQENGDATSWVEFLVDTDEKIPSIVQLGVNWEAP